MIERVGRAICTYTPPCYKCRYKAKAAIEAMREPTEEMIEAGRHEDGEYTAKVIYCAMIDAALKE